MKGSTNNADLVIANKVDFNVGNVTNKMSYLGREE